jgi:hypothetical protein
VDIIILALPRPDSKYSSTSFSLAKEFSRKHRVFYLENPFTVKDFWSLRNSEEVKSRRQALLRGKNFIRKINGLPSGFHQVIPRLVIPINWLSAGWLYDRLSQWNDYILYTTIRKLIKEMNIREFVYMNSFNPFFGKYFPKTFKPNLFVYHTVDNIGQAIFVSKHGLRLENALVKKADITVTTSTELKRLKSEFSDHVYHVPNAADIDVFSSVFSTRFNRPADLEGIDQKIVLYIGNIKDRIDFRLCKALAERQPEMVFMFIGPINTREHIDVGLAQLPNVKFIGARSMDELPAYLQHAHCTMIPFEYSILTKSIYPLKINEYLGAGMPVVSTRFSDDIIGFKDVIYLADTADEFARLIGVAVTEDSEDARKKRLAVAQANTWVARGEQFLEIIHRYLKR